MKETDIASKMVCHRCCEIAVKLHKYRTNAITNDKLLKDQCGQPYTPPIINQDEILRVAAKIVSEQMIRSKQSTSVSSETEKNDTSLGSNKIVRKVVYKHPSVDKLDKRYENIILPVQVYTSDVSPVISLNRSEVSDWYAEQVNNIQKKLTNIVVKRVSCNSSSTSSELLSTPGGITSTNDARLANVGTDTNNSNGGSMDRDKSLSSHQNESVASTVTTALTKAVPQSSLTVTKNVQQRAKKKTTRILHPSRKRSIRDDDDHDEVIPEKKSRSANSKVNLPNQLPSDKSQQKTVFPSSLDLVPTTPSSTFSASTSDLDSVTPDFEQVDCQNVMTTEKALSIFICAICNQICDTKKQLQDHERIHLKCKFCKKRIKNLKSLQKHQNETCFINIVKNPPSLQLTKVDSIKSVVERYPEAFKALTSEPETPHEPFENIKVEVLEDSIITEGIKLTNDVASPSDQFVECTRIVAVNRKPTIINNDARSSNIEIVCLTDDSDDDIQYSEIPVHPVLNNPKSNLVAKPDEHRSNVITSILPLTSSNMQPSAVSANKGNTVSTVTLTNTVPLRLDTFRKPQSYVNEREMIYSLFRKYNNASMKHNTSLQTNAIPANQIKCTSTNVIILDDLLSEFDKHRILIHFESKPRISAKFLEQPLFSEEVLETWQNKKAMNVENPIFSSYVKPIQLTPTVLVKSKVAHNEAKISIPAQKDPCSLILNLQQANTSAVNRSYSNQSSNTTIAKPVTSTISTSSLGQFNLVALPTTKATIIAQTSNAPNLSTTPLMINSAATRVQQSGYMQIVDTPNLISYPTLYIPQSGASIQNPQQNEKVIHVNNSVTNVNKYLVLAPGVGQLSGINLDYLNYSSLPLNHTLHGQQVQANQQQLAVLPSTTTTSVNSVQPLQTQSSMVRVKNLWELNQ